MIIAIESCLLALFRCYGSQRLKSDPNNGLGESWVGNKAISGRLNRCWSYCLGLLRFDRLSGTARKTMTTGWYEAVSLIKI